MSEYRRAGELHNLEHVSIQWQVALHQRACRSVCHFSLILCNSVFFQDPFACACASWQDEILESLGSQPSCSPSVQQDACADSGTEAHTEPNAEADTQAGRKPAEV